MFVCELLLLVRVLAMAPCLSQVVVLSKRLYESSWVLAWELRSITVLKGNLCVFKNKGTSL